MSKDTLFSQPQENIPPFQFDQHVVNAFDDMISRSVPHYHDLQTLILRLAQPFLSPNATILDCGCSTATSIVNLSHANPKSPLQFIGLDNSQPMLDQAKKRTQALPKHHHTEFIKADLNTHVDFPEHSLGLLILTLQFLPIENRQNLIQSLFNQCRKGGALLLVEKVTIPNSSLNQHYINYHHGFKKDQGYSNLEIAQKRDAIEHVLVPVPLEENINYLSNAGFTTIDIFFKWLNFTGIIAIK